MIIDGEKWACDACVRGHRVSNCHHSERPLQHINKKGRPVSQCAHCRTMRKSRAAHVRCECGSEKAHAKGSCPENGDAQADTCCCSHGARCSCALKSDHLPPVPESDSDQTPSMSVPIPKSRRPRAQTAQSESNLTIFTNGHHKPVHKNNNMAHKCGLPYTVPRAHSIHGQSSSSSLANRSVDNLPYTSTVDALHGESQIKDSIVSAQQEQRMVKSEHASPLVSPTADFQQISNQVSPLDLATTANDYNNVYQFDAYTQAIADLEQPIFSAGMSSASIDWSHYDGLDFNNDNFAASSYSQAASFNGFDFSSIDQPALTTTSTSGEQSEVEDFIGVSDTSRPALMNNQYGSDLDASEFGGEIDRYRLSTASSYIDMTQMQMLASNDIETLGLDEFLKGGSNGYLPLTCSNNCLPTTGYPHEMKNNQALSYDENHFSLPVTTEEPGAFWVPDYAAANNIAISHDSGRHEGNLWTQ
ncbi:hypothetical protein EYC80_009532 [Monilinia laxa]|uniref:Copper-fist domain-containing protein n=1 Tax=Monilinia laxa TaxID=61186 RepID=A0A5N6JYA9_MONLA|nr:hypothetical protein EYC80_009532 [Monilinia laxa]